MLSYCINCIIYLYFVLSYPSVDYVAKYHNIAAIYFTNVVIII